MGGGGSIGLRMVLRNHLSGWGNMAQSRNEGLKRDKGLRDKKSFRRDDGGRQYDRFCDEEVMTANEEEKA